MWDPHTKAKSLNEMKKTLLISELQCCICTSICLKPHHTCNEIYPGDQHKKVKDFKLPSCGSLTLSKVLSSAFHFPHETSTLKNLQTILTKDAIHTSSHCLQHSPSFMPEKKTWKEKHLKTYLMYMEGNKSYWALHIICWKVQARQLIIITAFNTELPLLLFEGISAGRTWLMELLTRAYHVQQQQDCHNPPSCSNHPVNAGFLAAWAEMALQIHVSPFHRLGYS